MIKRKVATSWPKPPSDVNKLDEAKLAYTMAELARALGVSGKTIYNLIQSKKLRSIKLGRSVRIPRESVTALLRGSSDRP